MPQLLFEDFIVCFKKQFIFQKGRGGRRISPYFTNYNSEQHLKNDVWAMMVLIYTGNLYGFNDVEIMNELHIKPSLYAELKEVLPQVLDPSYPDALLHKKVKTKIGLVKNVVLNTHFVKPIEKAFYFKCSY